MDPRYTEFSDAINGSKFDTDAFASTFNLSGNLATTFKFQGNLNIMNFAVDPPDTKPGFVASTSSVSSEVASPDDSDFSDDVLKYINTILMEENMEQKPSMFHDPFALQATEKSLYDVIGVKYPDSPNQPPLYFNHSESPDGYFFSSPSEQSIKSNTSCGNSIDSTWIVDPGEYQSSVQGPLFETTSQWSFSSMKSNIDNGNGPMNSSMSYLIQNMFSDSQSILQFKRGVEEASKFLPNNNQLVVDLPPGSKEEAPEVVVKVEKDKRESSPNGSRGRKYHHREDANLEDERSSKFSVLFVDESELSDMFDKVLLCGVKGEPRCYNTDEELQREATKTTQQNNQPGGSKCGKTRAKKQGNINEVVDLRTLLILCAQSVAAEDRRSAYEQLQNIRQHCSPTGDGSQRLANVFASGLEARLAGTGSELYAARASKRISAAEKLKAYQIYFSACPFKKITFIFANKMIADLAMNSSKKKLHIVDFGIQYGFQWPMLIQLLSGLPGGPPELRITGIELPQPGFRPTEFVEETGHRLAKYCERFNVRFQYHAIGQTWETIKIEDLNIQNDEVVAVNCLFRFKNLLDDSVVEDSPRDTVLRLIRKMSPEIFVHSIINGSYSAPFFVTRFRESLFYYSSLFDMFDTTIPREDQHRMNLEQGFYGREVMNVIACEGLERVERPETYKQWQVRNVRAGFRVLPLRHELLTKFKGKLKAYYHSDFMIDDDSQWMLQGWKGRILCASSCWVPA